MANANDRHGGDLVGVYYRILLAKSRFAIFGAACSGVGIIAYTILHDANTKWYFTEIIIIICVVSSFAALAGGSLWLRFLRWRESPLRLHLASQPVEPQLPDCSHSVAVFAFDQWSLIRDAALDEAERCALLPPFGLTLVPIICPAVFLAHIVFVTIITSASNFDAILWALGVFWASGASILIAWIPVIPGFSILFFSPLELQIIGLARSRIFHRFDTDLLIVDRDPDTAWVLVVVRPRSARPLLFRIERRKARVLFSQWTAVRPGEDDS